MEHYKGEARARLVLSMPLAKKQTQSAKGLCWLSEFKLLTENRVVSTSADVTHSKKRKLYAFRQCHNLHLADREVQGTRSWKKNTKREELLSCACSPEGPFCCMQFYQ